MVKRVYAPVEVYNVYDGTISFSPIVRRPLIELVNEEWRASSESEGETEVEPIRHPEWLVSRNRIRRRVRLVSEVTEM